MADKIEVNKKIKGEVVIYNILSKDLDDYYTGDDRIIIVFKDKEGKYTRVDITGNDWKIEKMGISYTIKTDVQASEIDKIETELIAEVI